MSIKAIEIKDVGRLEVKNDYLHRGEIPRLETYHKGRYKKVQFNNYREDMEEYPQHDRWQLGYDYEGNEIYIKVLQTLHCRKCKNFDMEMTNKNCGVTKLCKAKKDDPRVIVNLTPTNCKDYIYNERT